MLYTDVISFSASKNLKISKIVNIKRENNYIF